MIDDNGNSEKENYNDNQANNDNNHENKNKGSGVAESPVEERMFSSVSSDYGIANDKRGKKDRDKESEINRRFYSIMKNASNLRCFVDNNKIILYIVDLLMEKNLTFYAIAFLKKSIVDSDFSSPKGPQEILDTEFIGKKGEVKVVEYIFAKPFKHKNFRNDELVDKLEALKKLVQQRNN